jgi:uncharacterized membrane protein YdbT with pleckstrin-like domain
MNQNNELLLRPAGIFAFIKVFPVLLMAAGFLLLAWKIAPIFLLPSFMITAFGWYRFMFLRNCSYLITPEIIRVSRGIFFKRVDQLEMFRIKDYIITQPFILQLFKLMDLTLKSTDPENPILWLRGIPVSDIVDVIREHVQEARKHNQIVEIN